MERADIDWSLTSPKMLLERIFDRLPSMPADELTIVLTDFCLIGSALPERQAVKAVKRFAAGAPQKTRQPMSSEASAALCANPSALYPRRRAQELLTDFCLIDGALFRMQKRSKRSKRSYEKGSAVWLTHHSKSLAHSIVVCQMVWSRSQTLKSDFSKWRRPPFASSRPRGGLPSLRPWTPQRLFATGDGLARMATTFLNGRWRMATPSQHGRWRMAPPY